MSKTNRTTIYKSMCNSYLRWVIFSIFLVILTISCYGQTTYPVQVYTQLRTPYTPYLSSYYSGVNEKLKVTLINTDMQQPSLRVYLRMKIKSSSFTIETPPEVYTDHIELLAGVPVSLSLNDLAVYFKQNNMRISGARNEFLRTNMLPDNFYQFNFEVYEATTNRLLSNPKLGFAQAMIASGEPPLLNLPLAGTVIKESNIPSILFSWTPRHMNSVAAAYGTEYEITLAEIYDKQVSPEAAFNYSRVLYTETVRSTSFIHTAAQSLLIPGMRYGWRVRAIAREGVEEANVFKNNGFSAISWFDYAADCKTVQICGAVYENGKVTISWAGVDAMEYVVEYRKKGMAKWYTGPVSADACTLYNLQFGQEYEYRIGTRCVANDAFQYNDIQAFRVPAKEEKGPNCGILPDTNIANQTPTRELQSGLPILVGDFPVFITKVSGSGRFTGEGYVGIPYLQGAQIAVKFENIVVNTDNQMISGYIETKYDITQNNILFNADEFLTGGKGVGDIRTGEEKAQYTVDYTIAPHLTRVPVRVDTSQDQIKDTETTGTISGENERYIITLTDSNGKEQEQVIEQFPATIQDQSGAIYEVDKEGNIKQVSSKSDIILDEKTKYIQDTTIVQVQFAKTKNTKYELDVYQNIYSKVPEYEREYKVGDTESIRVSAKLMLPNTSDEIFVKAEPKDKDFDPEKVHFITDAQTEYKADYDSGKGGWTLSLVAPTANDGQLVYVVYEKAPSQYSTLAILKVLTYEPKEVNVMLVPVNKHDKAIDAASIQNEVNAIYNKFGVTVNIKVSDEEFNYTPIDGTFQIDGTGLFQTRTADMEALEKAFMETGLYNDQTVYLFVMDKPSNVVLAEGDMPRDSRLGYLFPSYNARTIAHEIGHGVFNLKHPFAKGILTNQFAEGELKDNLMDKSGTALAKLQWDALHSPGYVVGLFEKDGDGMIVQNAYYWTPSAEVIYLGTVQKGVTNTIYVQTGFPNGALYGFDYNKNTYIAHIEDGYFKGYAYTTTSPDGLTKEYHYYTDNTKANLKKEGDQVNIISRVYIGNCITEEYRNKLPKQGLNIWERTEEGSIIQGNEYFTKGEKINTLKIADCGSDDETGDSFFSPGSLSEVPYLKSIEASFDDLEEEITYAANKVNELMTRSSSVVYNNGYYRIHVDEGINVDETFLEHFDDKAMYLSEYSKVRGKQVEIYVVFQKFEKTIMANNWNGYAKKVYDKSNLNGSNAILITVPYFSSEFTTYKKDPWPYTEKLGFAMPGMYNKAVVSTSDIKKRSREGSGKTLTENLHTITYYNITLQQSLDFISDVYIYTAKPIKIHYGFLFPNGSTSKLTIEAPAYESGTEFCEAIILLKNKALDEIAQLSKPVESYYTVYGTSAGAVSYKTGTNPNYLKELFEYNRKYGEICAKASIADRSQWTQVENEILFKEKYMNLYVKKGYIEQYAFKSSFGQYKLDVYNTLGITSSFDWDNDHTYNKDNLTILDPIIYGVIDVSSFVAGFWGLDFIPDGIGLAYAISRQQPFEITSYSAGMVLVGVSGGYIRIIGKYGDNAVDYVRLGHKFYVKNAAGQFEEVLEDQIITRVLKDQLNIPNLSSSDLNKLETLIKDGRIPETPLNTILHDTDVSKKADLVASLLRGENLANNTIAKNTLKEALEPTTYRSLIDDFGEESMDLVRFVDNGKVNDELIESWKVLKGEKRTILCKDITTVEVLAKANQNKVLHNLGINISDLSKIEGFKTVSYQEIINKLDEFATKVSQNKLSLVDFNKVIVDLQKGGNFSDGAYWTVRYFSDNINEFANKSLKFEEVLKVGENIRRVDVVDLTKERKIFYEMKSVESVPPGHFSEQFIKDLTNSEVSDLSQIKWIFNGSKNPTNFRQNMIDAIDNLPLTDDLAKKFIKNKSNPQIDDLKDLLESKFDDIFKLIE